MTAADASVLTSDHFEELLRAIQLIEHPGLAARIAEQAGRPLNRIIGYLPRYAHEKLHAVVKVAIWNCLKTAIDSLPARQTKAPSTWLPKIASGISGGISGIFGMAALPIELPLTTTLMFRSIAEIARNEGEDLAHVEARLACLEVFALGDRTPGSGDGVGYYAARTVLTKLTNDAAAYLLVDRGVVEASTPVMTRLLAEIVSRFGFVVSERVAAGAIPLVAAFGGATVNVIFMEHFQRIARGHFVIRRLEREYGVATIRSLYAELVSARMTQAALDRPRKLPRLPGPAKIRR